MASPQPLLFSVKRHKPILVAPSKPTPHEFKYLSDIDAQQGLRFQTPVIQFYRYNPSMRGRDPAQVIRQALANALVFYYPLAGRLREEVPGRKLVVECTGEGVLFIEADAEVMLEQFGEALHPPFPCMEELLTEVPGSKRVLHCPLLLVQVTRLLCGGFVFALRINHTISDAAGLTQFFNAVCEMALGASVPSLLPVWQRHLLSARNPPRVTCVHHEYDQVANTSIGAFVPHDDVVHRSFFFGPNEISALRKQVPPHLHTCSTVDLLTACLWRCRTKAIGLDPDFEVRVLYIVDARNKCRPPLPPGYYGNVIALPAAISQAGKLCKNPLGYAVELVKKAKSSVTDEYMRSLADLMVRKGRPLFTVTHSFLVSDLKPILVGEVDFGWGKAVYRGPARGVCPNPMAGSFYVHLKNTRGEVGILVPICLPRPAMDIFSAEIESIINGPKQQLNNNSPKLIASPL
ncbi:benzyl alcohol O-benzoyltransferase-like [Magnolia sinica]|uniref:benzyl alcohol O-benzoyltransferase-like n=1 Tax=Magnolia sinica TaxID=86752 RepID=UPI00265840C6|nr:benzyl alcohol O-benzoyltransferase-like [Magnolia sinica]